MIDGKYIIKLKHEAKTGSLETTMQSVAADADHVYNTGLFTGFASGLTADELKKLRDDPNVSEEKRHPPFVSSFQLCFYA